MTHVEISLRPYSMPGVVATTFWLFFWFVSPLLALDNVWHASGVDPIAIISGTWLVFIGMTAFFRLPSLPKAVVRFIASMSGEQFLAILPDRAGEFMVCVGARIAGAPVFECQMRLDRVTKVEAQAGQASSFAGRDMDDWRTLVWEERQDGRRVHCVGPKLPRALAEADARRVRTALRSANWKPKADSSIDACGHLSAEHGQDVVHEPGILPDPDA